MAVLPPGGQRAPKVEVFLDFLIDESALGLLMPFLMLWTASPPGRQEPSVRRRRVHRQERRRLRCAVPRVSRLRIDALGRDDFSSNRHPALSFCRSMIFFGNR
jgi:hypothetical protein